MRIVKKTALGLFILIALIAIGGTAYAYLSTYPGTDEAKTILSEADREGSVFLFEPEDAKANLILYPGGLVDLSAYAIFAEALSQEGIRVYLVRMPLNLAILSTDQASKIIESGDDDLPWYVMGHSLGGASLSLWLSNEDVSVTGIIFLGSYPASDLSTRDIMGLSIYGSQDHVLDMESLEQAKSLMPMDTEYHIIEGGNHAYFGHYGPQRGDGEATITREEQQAITIDLIIDWMALP